MTRFRAFVAAFLLAGSALAAEHPSCVLTPEIRQVLAEFSPGNSFCPNWDLDCWPARERALRSATAGLPSQVWLAELLRLYEVRSAGAAGKEVLLERYRLVAEAAPQDPAAQSLWGALQPEGAEPSGLKRALALDPAYPLALFAASAEKALAAEVALAKLESFMTTCPARAHIALQAAPSLPNATFWRPHFARLRASLPTLLPGEKVILLQALWTAEFKVLPKEEQEALTRRVSAELVEMETFKLETWPLFWDVQRSAHELLGRDPDPLERRRAKYFPCDIRVLRTAEADARRALGLPAMMPEGFTANAEQRTGLFEAYDRLVESCPRDPIRQNGRLERVKDAPGISDERVMALIESAVASWDVVKANNHSVHPSALVGAEILLARNLAPDLALRLAVEAQTQLQRSLAWAKGLKINPEHLQRTVENFRAAAALGMSIEAELLLKRGDKKAARATLLRAHALLTEPKPITTGPSAMSYVKVRTLLAAADPEGPGLPELIAASGETP